MEESILNEFEKRPASARSMSIRKRVFCVGVNDAPYVVKINLPSGKSVTCPYYKRWNSMLNRCYSDTFKKRCLTYEGCTVVKEWHLFSNFRSWMEKQDWKGNHLDKDILIKDNKEYSPEACAFVDRSTNALLTDAAAIRGPYPQGVCYSKRVEKYASYISINSKRKHLGYYFTIEKASRVYQKAKANEMIRVAQLQSDPRVKKALEDRARIMLDLVS